MRLPLQRVVVYGTEGNKVEVVTSGGERLWKVDGNVSVVVVKDIYRLGSWIKERNVVCS